MLDHKNGFSTPEQQETRDGEIRPLMPIELPSRRID